MNNTECPICLRQESLEEEWDKETCEFVSMSGMMNNFNPNNCKHRFCTDCLWDLRMFNHKTGITDNKTKFEAPCPVCREDIFGILQQNYEDEGGNYTDEEMAEDSDEEPAEE